MKKSFISIVAVALLLAAGCGDDDRGGVNPTGSVVFSNSFEATEDTVGWSYDYLVVLEDEAPPGCGNRFLAVNGGCVQPAAWLNLPGECTEGDYRLNCWARAATDSGGFGLIRLVIRGSSPARYVEVGVESSKWAFYRSEKPLHCSNSDSLRLEILNGGFVPTDPVYIDCITIEKLE